MDYKYKAKCIRVIDGDTILADVDLGFGIRQKMTLRLAGINAPEKTGKEKPSGLKALVFLIDNLEGNEIVINTFKDKREKYGRYIATVYNSTNFVKSINDELVEKGFAVYKKY
jgi:micrococcal nuclease